MKVKELKPTTRIFEFVPTESDGLNGHTHTIRVLLECEDYILHVQSAYYAYHIVIKRVTGDVRQDLLSMTQVDLLSLCSLEKRFLLEESKNLVLRNIENACVDLNLNINDLPVEKVVNLIKAIDEDYFCGNCEEEHNAGHFVRLVQDIIRYSPLKESEHDIAAAVTDHSRDTTVCVVVDNPNDSLLQTVQNFFFCDFIGIQIQFALQDRIKMLHDHICRDLSKPFGIGKHWFYFTGMEDESISAESYLQQYDFDEIADMLHKTINEPPIKDGKDDHEWRYYKCILNRA